MRPVAVVTGGGGAIGGAVVEALLASGAAVAVLDSIPAQRPTDVLTIPCDVSLESDVRDAFSEVARTLGDMTLLVNAAGVSPARRAPALETPLADWQRALDVNATGTFLTCREFGARFSGREGGRIVNILSTASLTGFAGMAAYCASKGAALMLTRTLAVEFAAAGITVNGVAPGTIETGMTNAFRAGNAPPLRDATVREDAERTPLGRRGVPGDVASAVLYLLSPEARWVTGEVIVVDGGFMATGAAARDAGGRVLTAPAGAS